MGTIVGVLVGYAVGTRAGEQGWAEFTEAWKVISTSEEVRDLIVGGLGMARQLVSRGSGLFSEVLGGSERATLRPVA